MIQEAYLNELCNTLNCTRDELFTYLSDYQMSCTTTCTIITGILLLVCITLLTYGIIRGRKTYWEDAYMYMVFIAIMVGLAAVFGFSFNLTNFIGFYDNPNMAFLYYINCHIDASI